ncbi:MAG: 50S ribosomal protein L14e [Candidatus Undinarchaeales archaeon]
MDIGQVCIKNAGRESGNLCMVVDEIDESFVKIDGPRVKRRRCNVAHLDKQPKKLNLKKGASEKNVLDALSKAGLVGGKTGRKRTKKGKKSKKKEKEKKSKNSKKKKSKKKKSKKGKKSDLSKKSYKKLQKLAKKHDIKANQKKKTLVKKIKEERE